MVHSAERGKEPMKMSTWHPAVRAWLTTAIAPDEWYLEYPSTPGKVTAFVPPLVNTSAEIDGGALVGQGTQVIVVGLRYPSTMGYRDLPIGGAEGLYGSLATRWLMGWRSVAELLEGWLLPGDPVRVAEIETGAATGDWLLQVRLDLGLKWVLEAEAPIPGAGGPAINTVGLGVFRSGILDLAPDSLDFQITIDKT
jgi:hypothetical protein